jgi:hypothetical protein
LELISKNNPDKFTGAVFINDKKVCAGLLEFYQKTWDGASEDSSTLAHDDVQRAVAKRPDKPLAGY